MLFNYIYVEHRIEKFQQYLDHLVLDVWCKAVDDFNIDFLHSELKEILEEIGSDDSDRKDYLGGPIRRIYDLFKTKLTVAQRQQIALWYVSNNNIEGLCEGNPALAPATYSDIRLINEELEKELKTFYTNLWPNILGLAAVEKRVGSVDEHFRNAFLTQNKMQRCPYCGCREMMGEHHGFRDSYDHYLPKSIYPFNTVNFRNLAPMCDWCNSKYKLAKDPMRHLDPISRKHSGQRRKAFFSYSNMASGISISIKLNADSIENLQPAEIDLQITAPGKEEEVEGWKDIFGIEQRYKAKFCAENDGKYWLVQALDECVNVGSTADEILQKVKRNADASPWAECNFLKKPFLEACKNADLI
jgi:hypothetical protein